MLASFWNATLPSPLPISISFGQPTYLILIPILAIASWFVARRSLAASGSLRRHIHFAMRIIVLALLCAALAEPRIDRRSEDVAVIVIRDESRSVPLEQRRLIDDFLAASAKLKKPNDRMGVVTAAADGAIQALPTSGEPRLEIGSPGDTSATNLQDPVQLARAVIPQDAAARILLITDFNQTRGSIASAARAAATAGIPLDVAGVVYDRSRAVSLEHFAVPTWTREGDIINTRVVIQAGRRTTARLSIMLNSQPIDLDPDSSGVSTSVELNPGSNLFTVPVQLGNSPVNQFEAFIEPEWTPDVTSPLSPDSPELLRSAAIAFSSTRGRVLVLTDDPSATAPFVEAISSPEVTVDVRSAEQLPGTPAELASYDAVVLADQPASNFSIYQQEDLARYVRDSGGGLIVLGGPNALGAGGWIGSPLADAFPVILDPPQKRQLAKSALGLVIDSSGSMSTPVGGTTVNQQQIANESAAIAVRSLTRLDDVAVVTFNSSTRVVVPLTPRSNPDSITRAIYSIGSGGGTHLFPAFATIADELAKSNAGVKHVVILTDGQTVGDASDGIAVAADLKRRGITVSAIVIGDIPNDDLLIRISQAAGGRAYRVKSQDAQAVIPKIFIRETNFVRRALINEGNPFTPTLSSHADALAGLPSGLPSMSGYIITADRPGLSLVPIRGPENDPILAQWQHGLGRVTVFTSDAATRWNPNWVGWSHFPAFWKQQLQWTMRAPGDARSRIAVTPDGEGSLITLELFDDKGEHLSFARVRARAAGAESDLAFQQIGPGRYQARVPASSEPVSIVSIQYDAPAAADADATTPADPRRGALRAAIVNRPGEELRRPIPDRDLMSHVAALTRGRVYSLAPGGADLWVHDNLTFPVSSRNIWLAVAVAAVALFLIDVAARRISIDFKLLLALFSATPKAKRSATLSTLTQAKARAAQHTKQQGPPSAPNNNDIEPDLTRPSLADAAPSYLASNDPEPPTSAAGKPAPSPAPGAEDDAMARLRAAKKRAQK